MSIQVTAVIPTFNESQRIIPVANVVKACLEIGEVIIVDDGSNEISRRILSTIKGCRIIYLDNNCGKSFAVKKGIDESSGEYILLLDADLKGLTVDHVTSLVKTAIQTNADMVLGRRGKPHFLSGISGFSEAFTGERVVKKSFFIQHPEVLKQTGFLVEPAINRLLSQKGKTAVKVSLYGVSSTQKIVKYGFLIGMKKDIALVLRIVHYLGLPEFIHQLWWAKRTKTVY